MEETNSNEAVDLCTKDEPSDCAKFEPVENAKVDLPTHENIESSENVKIDAPESDLAGDKSETTQPEPKNITFKLIFNKQKMDITWNVNDTIASLKTHIHTLTGVPNTMQKLMFKGLAKDDQVLSDVGVTNGSKMMLVGSKPNDVISVNTKTTDDVSTSKESSSTKRQPLSKQKPHTKIIGQGIPDDAMPAYKNGLEPLPSFPLFNMMNKYGHRVRLTFKLETDQLWLGTKERTQKITMSSIKDVISEPISGHEEYHMLALQLGPTEQSRYWIYWVPAQYIKAIKEMILGKFY